VLAPRATRLPPSPEPPADEAPELPPEPPESPPPPEPESSDAQQEPPTEEDVDAKKQPPPPPGLPERPLDDVVLEAARAAIPAGLLDMLQAGLSSMARGQTAGRSGQLTQGRLRGRPSGVQRGEPRGGARINVIETLRAAAPWQALRRRELAQKAARMPVSETAGTSTTPIALESARRPMSRVQVRKEDFHITRFKQRSETATLFVVDASGSSALNRLAEAKGAVELLLADCYVRRDSVAVVAFRGKGAELLLPPTRSLVRAKRSLASLPGGGGTPLATAIDTVGLLALGIRRKGATPVIVMLTDGRGNIARDGSAGRPKAMEDAHQAALQLRAGGFQTLLLDTSPQPQAPARQLALAMGATYLPLPYAGAAALSQAVRAASRPTGQAGQAG
jgi:magnesium chelatase subunit D